MALKEEAVPQLETSWDETQCRAALAKLERLQEQLDDLRLTIHRVVQPLSAPPSDSSQLFSAFKQAAVGSQNNIKAFRAEWQSEEVQSILEHSKQSFKANPDLSPGAQVPRFGWKHADKAQTPIVRPMKTEGPGLEHIPTKLGTEDVGRIVDEFRKDNPLIKVETKDDNRDLMVSLVAGGLKLKFHISVDPEANGRDKLQAECLGSNKQCTSISQSVASRPRANDLKYLLDMIAAYKTVKNSVCAKCNRLLDESAYQPTARRSKQILAEDGTTETVWEAFHDSCLD